MSDLNGTTLITLSAAQLALIDQFQRERELPSRDAAVALLLDIAFEAVTGSGRRFWDKSIAGRQAYADQGTSPAANPAPRSERPD